MTFHSIRYHFNILFVCWKQNIISIDDAVFVVFLDVVGQTNVVLNLKFRYFYTWSKQIQFSLF